MQRCTAEKTREIERVVVVVGKKRQVQSKRELLPLPQIQQVDAQANPSHVASPLASGRHCVCERETDWVIASGEVRK